MRPIEAAQLARACGISVVPPAQDGSKRPDVPSWAKYQRTRANEAEVDAWYSNGRTGVGWVTGAVSGNLEVIDFDDRSAFAEFKRLCADSGLSNLLERIMLGYLEYSPNGAHIAYRCDEIAGNTKLAQAKDRKSLIETRGEGGFIIVAPSSGGVNPKGVYALESGGPDTIATITPDERRSLFEVAKILDETIAPEEHRPTTPRGFDDRPGDDFNAKAEWSDVLEGWTKVSTRLGVTSWRRPGKKYGISATTNHAGTDLLYVFSTSTEFEAERGYNKFSAYSILHHDGDFRAAARELSLQGYGVEAPQHVGEVDLSGILGTKTTKHKHPSIEELLRVPGLVGDLAEWVTASSPKPQPILALGASIAAMSAILGRKVQTWSGLRPNIYILGVGETGSGKERAREAVKALFAEIGAQDMVGESFASGTAIEAALGQSPACVYMIDEMGHFLGSVKNETTPGHVKQIVPMLLKMYSASGSSYRRTTYASKERNNESPQFIEQPSLSLYGTTVPGNLFSGITKAHLSDGFLSRLLVFESNDPDPYYRDVGPQGREVPRRLIDGFSRWHLQPTNPDPLGDLDELAPRPMIVEMTSAARSAFDGLENAMRAKRKAVRDSGDDQGPWTRVHAMAMKLALIRACGIKLERPEITESDARWGCELAWLLTERFVERVMENVSENKIEEATNRVLAAIKQAGIMTKTDLTNKTTWMRRSERAEIINSLIEAGRVEQGKAGKATTYRYVAK